MTMYNLLECRKNYRITTQSFWNYYRDEPNEESIGGGNGAINYSIKNLNYFAHKTSITGTLEGGNTKKEAEIVVPLKHLNNFWKTLDMPLINCEVNLILKWSENCVLRSKPHREKYIGSAVMKIHNFLKLKIQQMQHWK